MGDYNGPIYVWHREDNNGHPPTSGEGGYAGGDSTAAALTTALAVADKAVGSIDNLQVTATSLEYGQPATATITGTAPNKTINIGVPQGPGGMGAEEGALLVAAAQVAQAAAESAAPDAATLAANNVRDHLATDISTPGNPAYEALVDVAGNISDPQTANLIGDTTSATRAELTSAAPQFVSDARQEVLAADPRWAGGMTPTRTRAQNTAALIAALDEGIATGRPVRLPSGKIPINPIDRSGKPDHIVGGGATLTSDNRPVYGTPDYQDLWQGSVLVSPPGMSANQATLTWGQVGRSDSLRLEDFAVVSPDGSGIAFQIGSEYGVDGGGVPHRSRLKNISASNHRVGIVTSAENAFWSGLYIVAAEEGLYTQYPFNGNTVAGITVERCTKSAIVVDHCIANVFTGGVLQANTPANGSLVIKNSALSNTFLNFYMEDYPPAGLSSGDTWNEIVVGAIGGSTCYGNTIDGFHVGASSLAGTIPRIYLYSQVGTRMFLGHSASGTPTPHVEVGQGRDHHIVGNFVNGISGAYLNKGYWRNTTDQSGAHNFSQPLVSGGYVRVGSSTIPPSAVTAGAGAIFRDATYQVMVESDGTNWTPIVAHISGATNGYTGALDNPVAGWERRTHLRIMVSAMRLWRADTFAPNRGIQIRSARTAGDMTLTVQPGESMNGTANGSATIAPGQAVMLVSDGVGGYTTY